MSIENNLLSEGVYSGKYLISNLYKIFLKFSQGTDLNLVFFFQGCLSGFSLKYFFFISDNLFLSSSECLCFEVLFDIIFNYYPLFSQYSTSHSNMIS